MRCNGPPIFFFLNPVAAVFTLGLIVVLAGCGLKHRDMIAYHTLNYPAPTKEGGPPIRGTLMVYRFLPASSVDIDSLVISQSSGIERSAHYLWEDNPADMITELIVRDFESAGLFDKTVDQLSSLPYRYAMEGTIRKFQGLVQDGKGKAAIAVETALIDFEARMGQDKNLLKKLYEIEVPTPDTKPASIIKGLDLAVKEMSERLRNDIRAVLEPKTPEPEKKVPRKASRPTSKTSIKSRK